MEQKESGWGVKAVPPTFFCEHSRSYTGNYLTLSENVHDKN